MRHNPISTIALAVVAMGCAEPAPAGVALATPAVSAYTGPPRGLGVMGGIHPTKMGPALAAAGLDIRHLPPLETLAPGPKQRVMRTFSESLGLPCVDCHAQNDFKADTRRKRVARRMWNEMVRVVAFRDGSAVYCDSCHDGALFHLDRRDTKILAAYMCTEMAERLQRADGRTHDCTTCHGDPPDLNLLETWKSTPAPEIVLHETRASGPVLTPTWPIESPRHPADCGPSSMNCPLAAWMRLTVAPAVRHRADREELPRILERVAAYAPDDPEFVGLANAAAAAARNGNAATLQAACGACHSAFKAKWREHHRTAAPR
jgi:hypothetical protein